MRNFLVIFNLILVSLFSQNKIVAIVGNKPVFESDIIRKSRIENIDYKTSLNSLVEEKLLLYWAEKENIEVKGEEIKNEIERIKKSFSRSEDFYNYLKRAGMNISQFEEEVANSIKIKKLIKEKIISRIQITPVEIYEEAKKIESKYYGYEFYFKWFDSKETCEKFIKEFNENDLKKMEYAKLKSSEIIEEILNVIEYMEKGKLSEPFQVKGKWFVVYLYEKSPLEMDKYKIYKEAKDRIFKVKYSLLYNDYIEKLKNSTPIKIL
jgi:parvulin-like peptidyl-prolyl isomerase